MELPLCSHLVEKADAGLRRKQRSCFRETQESLKVCRTGVQLS